MKKERNTIQNIIQGKFPEINLNLVTFGSHHIAPEEKNRSKEINEYITAGHR